MSEQLPWQEKRRRLIESLGLSDEDRDYLDDPFLNTAEGAALIVLRELSQLAGAVQALTALVWALRPGSVPSEGPAAPPPAPHPPGA